MLNGDLFDLSVDPPSQPAARSVAGLLLSHPDVCVALREHLSRGDTITLLAGNHDAPIMSDEVRSALLSSIGVTNGAKLQSFPWFIRRGRVHIEHGHFYDPDNAPNHPLSLWSPDTEPLGIALTRRFLAPQNALQFAHAHETTPLNGLRRAFSLYGRSTPWVVMMYFKTAIAICLQAGRQSGLIDEKAHGDAALGDFSRSVGLSEACLRRVLALGPVPTHHHFRSTFARLYFDRIVAALSCALGGTTSVITRSVPGAVAAVAAGLYLRASLSNGVNRYQGLVQTRLAQAARTLLDITDAAYVVFGHTHVAVNEGGYFNCGSFGHPGPTGRSYLALSDGVPAVRHAPP